MTEPTAPPCDGDHAMPVCPDPQCWHREPADPALAPLDMRLAEAEAWLHTLRLAAYRDEAWVLLNDPAASLQHAHEAVSDARSALDAQRRALAAEADRAESAERREHKWMIDFGMQAKTLAAERTARETAEQQATAMAAEQARVREWVVGERDRATLAASDASHPDAHHSQWVAWILQEVLSRMPEPPSDAVSLAAYLKDGETVIACVERHRKDIDALLTVMAEDKHALAVERAQRETLHRLLDRIEDEAESRPGEQTMDGRDGREIDGERIRMLVREAREILRQVAP